MTEANDARTPLPRVELENARDYLQRYPRVCAHIIAESLGYAVPLVSASILKHAKENKPHYCEWIDACYSGDARRALEDAIRHRHNHKDYMAEFKLAYALVQRANETGQEPELASWF